MVTRGNHLISRDNYAREYGIYYHKNCLLSHIIRLLKFKFYTLKKNIKFVVIIESS